MPKIIALPPMTEDPAADDLIPIHNTSTGDTEKVTIADITGSLNSGWITVSDTWEYSSWSSTTKIGVITVSAGATSLYGAGMRIRITQATGGTKYGIIVKVTSTELTVYFGTDYTLNNEAITAPGYSQQKAPLGFPLDPAKWKFTKTLGTERSFSTTTLTATADTLALPIGVWEVSWQFVVRMEYQGTGFVNGFATLSTNASTETNGELTIGAIKTNTSTAVARDGHLARASSYVTLAADTTFTVMGKVSTTSGSPVFYISSTVASANKIEAVCAYL